MTEKNDVLNLGNEGKKKEEKNDVLNLGKKEGKEGIKKVTKVISDKKTPPKVEGGIDLGSIKKPIEKKKVKQRKIPPSGRKVKKGTKLGMKWMIILGVLFFLFLIVLLFLLIFIINNPDMGSSFGFSVNTNKQISMSIAFLIFVPFFMLFLILFLIYAYRLITTKVGKLKNIAISITIFIFGTINIIAGTWTFLKIDGMGEGTKFAINDTLVSYIENIETDDNKPIEKSLYHYPLIAPLRISFSFNTDFYNTYQRGNIEDGDILEKKLLIYCGNNTTDNNKKLKDEQVIEFTNIEYIIQNKIFSSGNTKIISNKDKCLYIKKGKYTLRLELQYEGEGGIKKVNLSEYEIEIDANLDFLTSIKHTDDASGLIIGNPGEVVKIEFKDTINDLPGVNTFEMEVDFDGDKKIDTAQGTKSFTTHIYDYPKEYNIRYKFLGSDYPMYKFQGIIEPGDKPTCHISYEDIGDFFRFEVKAISRNGEIEKYNYFIKTSNGKQVDKGMIKGKEINGGISQIFDYKFKEGLDYFVEVEVEDSIGETGKCKTDAIVLSNKKAYDFDMELTTKIKGNKKTIIMTGDTIIVKRLPTEYNFKLLNLEKNGEIVENFDGINIGFDTTGDGKANVKKDVLAYTIKTAEDKIITIVIEDNLGNKYKKEYKLEIKLQNLVADLTMDKNKGEVPFIVNFDASASELLDKNDEILKFIWDFGDSTSIEESREGKREHTYKKEGRYEPKVTIVTAKGNENTVSTIINAQIGIKDIDIVLDSHPTGTAWEGDRIIMNIKTGGVGIKKVNWDFGDGKKYTCEKSECFDVVHVYEEAGNYKITAKAYLQDNSPPSSGRKAIKIRELK